MIMPICRLCLKVLQISSTSFSIYDTDKNGLSLLSLVQILIPELYIKVSTDPIICSECHTKLLEVYKFRMQCLKSENLIALYMKESQAANKTSINLEDVIKYWYQKQRTAGKPATSQQKESLSNLSDEISEFSASIKIMTDVENTQNTKNSKFCLVPSYPKDGDLTCATSELQNLEKLKFTRVDSSQDYVVKKILRDTHNMKYALIPLSQLTNEEIGNPLPQSDKNKQEFDNLIEKEKTVERGATSGKGENDKTSQIKISKKLDETVNATKKDNSPEKLKPLIRARPVSSLQNIRTLNHELWPHLQPVVTEKDNTKLTKRVYPGRIEISKKLDETVNATKKDNSPEKSNPLIRARPVSSLQNIRTLNHELWPQLQPVDTEKDNTKLTKRVYPGRTLLKSISSTADPGTVVSDLKKCENTVRIVQCIKRNENTHLDEFPSQVPKLRRCYVKYIQRSSQSNSPSVSTAVGVVNRSEGDDLMKNSNENEDNPLKEIENPYDIIEIKEEPINWDFDDCYLDAEHSDSLKIRDPSNLDYLLENTESANIKQEPVDIFSSDSSINVEKLTTLNKHITNLTDHLSCDSPESRDVVEVVKEPSNANTSIRSIQKLADSDKNVTKRMAHSDSSPSIELVENVTKKKKRPASFSSLVPQKKLQKSTVDNLNAKELKEKSCFKALMKLGEVEGQKRPAALSSCDSQKKLTVNRMNVTKVIDSSGAKSFIKLGDNVVDVENGPVAVSPITNIQKLTVTNRNVVTYSDCTHTKGLTENDVTIKNNPVSSPNDCQKKLQKLTIANVNVAEFNDPSTKAFVELRDNKIKVKKRPMDFSTISSRKQKTKLSSLKEKATDSRELSACIPSIDLKHTRVDNGEQEKCLSSETVKNLILDPLIEENTINIKNEPVDSSENLAQLISTDGSSRNIISEISSIDNISHQSDIVQLIVDNIPEVVDDQYDEPEYIHINNVNYNDLENLIKVSKEAENTWCSPKKPPRNKKGIKNDLDFSKKTIEKRIRRKRLKIVPVDEPPSKAQHPPANRIRKKIKNEKNIEGADRNVCVLFTSFTSGGDYINDHDYLVGPYLRNKIAYIHESEPVCVCLLCDFVHQERQHIEHMEKHKTICNVCHVDFNNAFILNLHVKSHSKFCNECQDVITYGSLESHYKKHNKSLHLSNIDSSKIVEPESTPCSSQSTHKKKLPKKNDREPKRQREENEPCFNLEQIVEDNFSGIITPNILEKESQSAVSPIRRSVRITRRKNKTISDKRVEHHQKTIENKDLPNMFDRRRLRSEEDMEDTDTASEKNESPLKTDIKSTKKTIDKKKDEIRMDNKRDRLANFKIMKFSSRKSSQIKKRIRHEKVEIKKRYKESTGSVNSTKNVAESVDYKEKTDINLEMGILRKKGVIQEDDKEASNITNATTESENSSKVNLQTCNAERNSRSSSMASSGCIKPTRRKKNLKAARKFNLKKL